MSAWKDFGRTAVFAVAMAVSGSVFAENFDEGILVTDKAEPIVVSSDAEMINPGQSVLVQPEENVVVGPVSDSFSAPTPPPMSFADESSATESFATACDECGTAGCTSCCDAGCTSCMVNEGWINRILGPANPRWVAQVDALMLWQGNIASRPLFTDSATGLTALDVNQARPPMSAGPRYGLFFNVDQCHAIEGNYFNVGQFAGSTSVPAGTYTAVNMPALFVPPTTDSTLTTSGQIQSAELNLRRRQCGRPITWLAGFRWVEWNQQLMLVDAAMPSTAYVDSRVGNDLYGGQLGMDVSLWEKVGGPVTVNAIGKAGVFSNNAFHRTSETDQSGILRGPESATATATSFFGEVGVNGSVRLTRWLAWRAGYSLFWLSGVAVPANQLSLVSLSETPGPATINTNGSVLLHGVTTGLEARW